MNALGLIEVVGFVAAICGADAALKAANINLMGISKVGSGIVTVKLCGDVSAVSSAVAAGADAAKKVGELRHTHVIASVSKGVDEGLLTEKRQVDVATVAEFKEQSKRKVKVEAAAEVQNG